MPQIPIFKISGRTVADFAIFDRALTLDQVNNVYQSTGLLTKAPPILLNAGGGAYTDTEGRNWISDVDYVQGGCLSTTSDTREIGNTENDKLYRTANFQCKYSFPLEYEIPVPAVGDYVIKLYFAGICLFL